MKRLFGGLVSGLVLWLSPAIMASALPDPSSFCLHNSRLMAFFIENRDGYTQDYVGDFSLRANYLTQRVTCEWVAPPHEIARFDAPSGSFIVSPGPVPYIGMALTAGFGAALLVRRFPRTMSAAHPDV